MRKTLLFAAALLATGFATAQTCTEIEKPIRFHAMSEDGKYLVNFETGYIGVLNTEDNTFTEWNDAEMNHDLGMGNMVTNDGFLVGCALTTPTLFDITNHTKTPLGVKEGEENNYSCANGITPSKKYIVGYIGTGKNEDNDRYSALRYKPAIWTRGEDGNYGVYEDLPYPTKDYSGVMPKGVLPNWVSEDGSVIAGQMTTQENNHFPIVWRRQQDGSYTYELYDKGVCEPGTVFPERPEYKPQAPDYNDYMTEDMAKAYEQDMVEYKDSLWKFQIGECEKPKWYPVPNSTFYMTQDMVDKYNKDFDEYQSKDAIFNEQKNKYRYFLYDENNVKPNFYAQNAVTLSANGKYYGTTKKDWSSVGGSVMLKIGETLEYNEFDKNLYGQSVTNDGDFFVTDQGTAYVYPAGKTERITVAEWLRSKGENKAADWLDARPMPTGTAICSSDGRVLSGFSFIGDNMYSTWLIKLGASSTGINDIETSTNPDAIVKAYDIEGRIVAEGPSSKITKNLKKGIYIVNGRKIVVR